MYVNLFDSENLKTVFSGHETFPLRYGWLKKTHDEVLKAESVERDAKDVFNDPASISAFGVGKNMVASMRHWATHTGVLKDNKLTDYAKEILADDGLDPWMEHPTTLWLLHWHLARQESLVTYHWFFNYYNGTAFDRKFLNDEIFELCEKKRWKAPSATTLKRDVECFIRMYLSRDISQKAYDDDAIESPLAELSLIKPLNKNGFFVPNRGPKLNLTAGVFLLAVAHFWEENHAQNSSLSFDALMYEAGAPGRVFLLDELSLLDLINFISNHFNDYVMWSETAGMRQFTRNMKYSLADMKNKALALIREEYSHS
ncbi:MAG: DUF4007 family protein [Neisseriaceae bacterium]|nr:DUF4007 family protein [Neisseriaceae bacterium]